jgi:hypothetical protein
MPITVLNVVLTILALVIFLGLTYSMSGNGERLLNIALKVLTIGGAWLPLLVFTIHVFLSQVLHLYDLWPPTDIPMHFSGGVAIAFFISRCFQLLPRTAVKRSRVALLELLLIGSLTATATVFWEFAEFSIDQVLGTNVQLGLANTIKDMAMGILGSLLLILIRMRQLRIGKSELREITFDWVHGEAA